MKRPAAGSYPDTFDERIRRGRFAEGEIGQYINTAHGFTSVGNSQRADRFGWPICHIAGQLVFDWAPGDGGTPYVGPALNITDGGGPDETDVSPWTRDTGAALLSALFTGTQARRTATALTPTAGQDVRVIAVMWPTNDRSATIRRVFSTRTAAGIGVTIQYRGSTSTWYYAVVDNAGAATAALQPYVGWTVIDGYWDLNGNVTLRANNAVNVVAAPGGAHAPGDGVGVGAFPNGAGYWLGRVARILMYYGNNLDNAADHADIVAHVLGYRNAQGTGNAVLARTTAATYLRDTHYHIIGSGGVRAGGAEGVEIEATRINLCYNNVNPQATTGWTTTGGVLTVQDDTAALRTAGLLESGPNVIQLANATGAPQTVRCGAATGNVNPASLSVFGRITAGAGPHVGLWDVSAANFAQDLGAMTDNYVRTMVHGTVPGDTDRMFAIQVPDNCTIRVTWAQLEESPRCTSPIPNLQTAATQQRNFDDLTTADDPLDGGGSVELTVTPVDWSANEAPGSVLFLSGSGNAAIYVQGGTWWARIDGTTQLDSGVAPVDGTPHRIRLRWVTGGQQSIEVWDATPQLLARVASAYDGTLYSAGTWELASNNGSMLVTDFHTYRNGGG